MFKTQVLISFLAGGLLTALQTLIAERVNPKFRGIVLTIPTTLAVGLLFIAITKSQNDLLEAITMIPAGEGITYIFVTIIALMIKRGFFVSLATGFLAWGIGSYVLLKFPPLNFISSILFYGAPTIIICYLLIRKIKINKDLKIFPINGRNILTRAIFSGLIISTTVILAKTLGNFWGGLFAVFPAGFTSTLMIFNNTQGSKSIPSVCKSLFFPGAIGFIIYALAIKITAPALGIWLATLIAYCTTFIFFWFSTFEKKQKP